MKQQRAFTLLEVLIALAMLAVALSAASRGIGMAASQATQLGERHIAQWIAQNRLAESRMMERFPDAGSAEGEVEQGGYTFRWHEDIKAVENPLLRRIDVIVYGRDGTQLAKLIGFASKA